MELGGEWIKQESGKQEIYIQKNNVFMSTNTPEFSVKVTKSGLSTDCCDLCVLKPPYDVDSLQPSSESPVREYFDLFYDPADTLCASGKTIEPTLFHLGGTIDCWLEAYFYLQGNLEKDSEKRLPPDIYEYVEREIKKVQKSRKRLFFPLPEINRKMGSRTCVNFAINAQILYLAQRLLVRTDASTVTTSPEHLCCFLPYSVFRKMTKTNADLCDFDAALSALYEHPFALEDYILYERITACSLFVEITASLNTVDNHSREACLKILCNPENLVRLIGCPEIFSRITVARQFVFETARLVNCRFRYSNVSDVTDEESTVQKIFDLLLSDLQAITNVPLCINVHSQSSLTAQQAACRDQFSMKIGGVTAPINLVEYAKNPIYGPVAFVNPRHDGTEKILKQIEEFNRHPQAPPQIEKAGGAWRPFMRLCAAAEQID